MALEVHPNRGVASIDTLRVDALTSCRNLVTQIAGQGSDETQLTEEQLGEVFNSPIFGTGLFKLFDHDAEGTLDANKITELVRYNLSNIEYLSCQDFIQLFESCIQISVTNGQGKVTPRDFQRAIGSQNLSKQLFKVFKDLDKHYDLSEDDTVSVDELMRFIRNMTTLSSRIAITKKELDKFAEVFRKNAKNGTMTRENFAQMVASKNKTFTKRAFDIMNKSGTGNMNLDEYTETLAQLGKDNTKAAIQFLFQIYDEDGNGLLEYHELLEMLRTSTEDNGLVFDAQELDDLTRAMWEDAKVENDRMTLSDFTIQIMNNPEFAAGLANSILKWCSPQPKGNRVKIKKESINFKNYLYSNWNLIVFMTLFLLTNIGLFVWRLIVFSYWKNLDGETTNVYLMMARGNGMCLNFNSAFLLIFILRYTITTLRKLGLVKILPLDQHIFLHKFAGILIFVQAWWHTISHFLNFGLNIIPDPVKFLTINKDRPGVTDLIKSYNINGAPYEWYDWLLTPTPGILGLIPGSANLTGIILTITLTIMVICSMPFVRRSGHFEIFYFTHLLYFVYFTCLILHAPSCWQWMIGPLIVFALEISYRRISNYAGALGQSVITEGIVLPSKVTGLVIKKPANFKHSPGDWVFVKIPQIALFEWHPFTISSAPEEKEYFTLHIRGAGGWTRKLYEYFESEYKRQDQGNEVESRTAVSRIRKTISRFNQPRNRLDVDMDESEVRTSEPFMHNKSLRRRSTAVHYIPGQKGHSKDVENARPDKSQMPQKRAVLFNPLKIYIDGPFGAPASNIFRAKHAVLIATGIGVTPFSSILQSIMHRFWANKRQCPNCDYKWTDDVSGLFNLQKVDFFWINREQRSFEWFVKLLSQLEIEQAEKGSQIKRFLDMHMYITSAHEKTDMRAVGLQLALDLLHKKEKRDLVTGLRNRTKAGRPNWDKLFEDLKSQNRGDITVFYCGNPALAGVLQKKCEKFGFTYRKEVF